MAQQTVFLYQSLTIFKDQILGCGSYGAVYKAKCDQLICAAKVLHPTIIDPSDPGSRKILQRFQLECDILNRIRHPHIVQYLGVCKDHETNSPVLLMELLDSSLTKMLEHSPLPIPYHIQVELSSDVSLAVAYLHSNDIVHRDLSGNNVLIIAGRRAKVTDFGMSRLIGSEHHSKSLTLCPGTLAYMSPESLKEPPRYTKKLDVFSQGVIMIQVCTGKFPEPEPARKEVEDPRSQTGSIQVPVLEPERRNKHIRMIETNHPLLPVALACLEYKEESRPSAEELCQKLESLKQNTQYNESIQHTSIAPATPKVNSNGTLQRERDELARQIDIYKNQAAKFLQEISVNIQDQSTKTKQIAAKDQEIKSLQMQLKQLNAEKEGMDLIFAATTKITARDQGCEMKRLQQVQLTQEKQTDMTTDLQVSNQSNNSVCAVPKRVILPTNTDPKKDSFQWKICERAPFKGTASGFVVKKHEAYFLFGCNVYSFNSATELWNTRLPKCPNSFGSLAVVCELLTVIGGCGPDSKATNKLVSFEKRDGWGHKWNVQEKFPPMLTCRLHSTVVTYHNHLIVTGGSTTIKSKNRGYLDSVEVLNMSTLTWYIASSLPRPFAFGSATICGDYIYLLGGCDKGERGPCRFVYICLLPELLRSLRTSKYSFKSSVWKQTTDTPMYESTCATVNGQVVAIGGRNDSHHNTTEIYEYNQGTQSWSVISHMKTARRACNAATMNNKKLLIVSGIGNSNDSDSDDIVEIARF